MADQLDRDPRQTTGTTTGPLIKLIEDSEGRNRGPVPELIDKLDPEGIHLVTFSMIHNDHEIRASWLIKLVDAEKPAVLWMDNDVAKFMNGTVQIPLPMPGHEARELIATELLKKNAN